MHQVQDQEEENLGLGEIINLDDDFFMQDVVEDNQGGIQIIIMDDNADEEEVNELVLLGLQYPNEEGQGEIEELGGDANGGVGQEVIEEDAKEIDINGLEFIGFHYADDEGEEGELEEVDEEEAAENDDFEEPIVFAADGEEEEGAENDDFEEPIVFAADGEEEEGEEEEEEEEEEGEDGTLEFEDGSPFRFIGGEGDVPQIVLVVPNIDKRDGGESKQKEPTSLDLTRMPHKNEHIRTSLDELIDFYVSEGDEDEPMEDPLSGMKFWNLEPRIARNSRLIS